jgi:hypothetical protein
MENIYRTTKSKLNSVCYPIRSLRSVISTKVYSIMTYGLIFGGSSPYSDNIFKLQKRTIRIMMNVGNRVSWHELFKKLSILPLHSQYILSLLLFVVKNVDEFKSNFEVHSINTHHRSDLFPPATKLTKYHKGVYYSGITIFTNLKVLKTYLECQKILISTKKVSCIGFILYTWWISWLELCEWSWYSDIILHNWYY